VLIKNLPHVGTVNIEMLGNFPYV